MTDDIFGHGFAFPFAPNGSFGAVSGADAVVQSIRHILLTQPGERVGRPNYGAGLRRFLFQPNNVGTRALLQSTVIDAVRRDEPRAVLQTVEVETAAGEPTRLDIRIQFVLIGKHVPMNLVFPFYLDGA